MRCNLISRFVLSATVVLTGALCVPAAQPQRPASTDGRISLGRLATGATASFVRSDSGEWGIEVTGAGTPRIAQQQPARLEVFNRDVSGTYLKDDIRQLAAGYKSVDVAGETATARAELAYRPGVAFRVEDRWSVAGGSDARAPSR